MDAWHVKAKPQHWRGRIGEESQVSPRVFEVEAETQLGKIATSRRKKERSRWGWHLLPGQPPARPSSASPAARAAPTIWLRGVGGAARGPRGSKACKAEKCFSRLQPNPGTAPCATGKPAPTKKVDKRLGLGSPPGNKEAGVIRCTWRHAWAGGKEQGLEAAAGGENRRRRQQAHFWQESRKTAPDCAYSLTAKVPDASHPAGAQIAISGWILGVKRGRAQGVRALQPSSTDHGRLWEGKWLASLQHHPAEQEASLTGAARLPCKQNRGSGQANG